MILYGTDPVINPVLFGVKESWKYPNLLWIGRGKGKGFFSLVLLCGREVVGQNWNGKTYPADQRSVSVRGRIGVEDLCDFRRGLGKVYLKNKPLKVRSILIFYFRISPNF
jgi:hypothetical protein